MALARSKGTAQGQISVPAGIRKRLGITPGSILEWEEEGEKIVVRRAGRYSSEDIHRALFPNGPPEPHTLDEMKAGIERDISERYARHGPHRAGEAHYSRQRCAGRTSRQLCGERGLGIRSGAGRSPLGP